MKLYYDRRTVVESIGEEFIIYNPGNHRWIKVNSYLHHLIGLLLITEGQIDAARIMDSFHRTFGMMIGPDLIEEWMDTLLASEVFFPTPEELEETRRTEAEKERKNQAQRVEEIYVHPTLRCNYNCLYCFHRSAEENMPELGTAEWVRILHDLAERGVKRIHFSGGEPLLREDLEQILRETRYEGVQYTLLTNGRLLWKRFDSLIPHVDQVILSLDRLDFKTLSPNLAGGSRIVETIRLFAHHAPEKLKLCVALTRSNQAKALDFQREVAERYGIATVFAWLTPYCSEEVGALLEWGISEPERMRRPQPDRLITANQSGICQTVLAIDPQGYVYPCHHLLRDEFIITNVLRNNWYTEWERFERAKGFGQVVIDQIEKCRDCSNRYFCGGIGMCAADG